MVQQKIKATIIVQLAGAPKDYLLETLKTHVSSLDSFKNIQVLSKNFSEPKPFPEKEEFFSVFAEIEFYANSLSDLLSVVLTMLPSSIEITEPSSLNLDIFEINDFLNNLAGRIHYYEDILRLAHAKIKQLSPNKMEQKQEEIKKEKTKVKKKKSKKQLKN